MQIYKLREESHTNKRVAVKHPTLGVLTLDKLSNTTNEYRNYFIIINKVSYSWTRGADGGS